MQIKTPDWVKHAVFYQIFPDRFARSPRTKHPKAIQFKEWGTPPEEQGYQGGDLYGVVDQLDYLKDLGITAIYLCPIFSSASNHRYHTFDYYQVDPLLGGNAALRELLDEAHKRDMKIVLDGVFNHASRGFWQFHHILENGGNSPYIDWFNVHAWPLSPYTRDPVNEPHNYDAWWDLPMLPRFNHKNEGVREFIFDVARHWIEFGIDGWRLDVPFEIDDDSFWQEFRRVVKAANPEAYIVGECWEESQRWLQGDQFDAVMNYIFAWGTMSFFGKKTLAAYPRQHYKLEPRDAKQFAEVINYMYGLYDWEINYAQLNMLDSHDTARALWVMGGDKSALKLTTLFHMTAPGAPCIYYGDEIGMTGADDPHCRGAFPWHQPETWHQDLLAHYKEVIALRNRYPILRTGTFEIIHASGDVVAFKRTLNGQSALVAINAGKDTYQLTLDAGLPDQVETVYGSHPAESHMGKIKLQLPPREGVVVLG